MDEEEVKLFLCPHGREAPRYLLILVRQLRFLRHAWRHVLWKQDKLSQGTGPKTLVEQCSAQASNGFSTSSRSWRKPDQAVHSSDLLTGSFDPRFKSQLQSSPGPKSRPSTQPQMTLSGSGGFHT